MPAKKRKAILRLGLMGAGRMGTRHAINAAVAKGMSLAAVHDPDGRACRVVSEICGAAVLSERQMLADSDIDGVIIASPASEHARQAIACVRAKKAFLCEKPVASDLAGVRRLVTASKKSRVPAMMAFNRRFDAQFAAMRQHVRDGGVGKVEMLRLVSRSEAPPSVEYARQSGGLLRDKGSHFFDLACWIAGKLPVKVYATGGIFFDRKLARVGDIDTAMLILELEGGTLCQFDFSRRAAYGHDERIEVFGSKGMVECAMEPVDKCLYTHADGSSTTKGRRGDWRERYAPTYADELAAFADALRQGKAMPVQMEAGLSAEAIATAAHRSLRDGKAVKVSTRGVGRRCFAA